MKEFDIKKSTYNFSKKILDFTKKVRKTSENLVLVKQVIRSGTSIGANVHESKGGTSKKDFSNYFAIATKSTNETIYWLNLIKDTNIELNKEAGELLSEAEEKLSLTQGGKILSLNLCLLS